MKRCETKTVVEAIQCGKLVSQGAGGGGGKAGRGRTHRSIALWSCVGGGSEGSRIFS